MKRLVMTLGCMVFAAPLCSLSIEANGAAISFAQDIQPIFDMQCVVCHNADDPHGTLSLERGTAHDLLVNVHAVQVPAMMRVAPGAPKASYLVNKLEGSHLAAGGSGWQMPPPTHPMIRISAADRQLIIQWIADGARDN